MNFYIQKQSGGQILCASRERYKIYSILKFRIIQMPQRLLAEMLSEYLKRRRSAV